jgi:hypothetical protein
MATTGTADLVEALLLIREEQDDVGPLRHVSTESRSTPVRR